MIGNYANGCEEFFLSWKTKPSDHISKILLWRKSLLPQSSVISNSNPLNYIRRGK